MKTDQYELIRINTDRKYELIDPPLIRAEREERRPRFGGLYTTGRRETVHQLVYDHPHIHPPIHLLL
jgi:hypothetical protein